MLYRNILCYNVEHPFPQDGMQCWKRNFYFTYKIYLLIMVQYKKAAMFASSFADGHTPFWLAEARQLLPQVAFASGCMVRVYFSQTSLRQLFELLSEFTCSKFANFQNVELK